MSNQVVTVTAHEAWDALSKNENSLLLDVRTKEELSHDGAVDLSTVNKNYFNIELFQMPDMNLNQSFLFEVEKYIGKNSELYLICKVGGRSHKAAEVLSGLGYRCYNISGGFIGDIMSKGWKEQGLPWKKN